ncbi:hypothetical protein JOF56_009289 [Kibdelosporangium banguiense]|uniref:Uncharacterized protein n=1 Tax=Kibdelosporangium banguiense TaxID=1365924 RepID=A0ABS4TWX4_9PSEU|nr:hypothetical protein [Kibdelosporangium banguiense]MBP2328904.1 hypothetical protein [Kibdelosporangium banguiense]
MSESSCCQFAGIFCAVPTARIAAMSALRAAPKAVFDLAKGLVTRFGRRGHGGGEPAVLNVREQVAGGRVFADAVGAECGSQGFDVGRARERADRFAAQVVDRACGRAGNAHRVLAAAMGVTFQARTPAIRLESLADAVRVHTGGGRITARHVVADRTVPVLQRLWRRDLMNLLPHRPKPDGEIARFWAASRGSST